ncbi:MAG: hypothetical protein QM791_08340 [Ferruginibacter sp.]
MYIVHVGSSYFPKGNAAVQRIRVTYRALNEAGFSTLIINKETHRSENNMKRVNRFEGIPYVYTTAAVSRPKSWIASRFNRLTGIVGELKLLFKLRRKIGSVILYNTSSFSELLYYRLLSWLLNFKLVFQYVEFRSSFVGSSAGRKINNYLFDNYSNRFTDGVIVISEYLRNEIRKRNSKLPLIKIPQFVILMNSTVCVRKRPYILIFFIVALPNINR